MCEPDKSHVLIFDRDYNLLQNYGMPEGLDLSVAYKPTQIVVDSLYVHYCDKYLRGNSGGELR